MSPNSIFSGALIFRPNRPSDPTNLVVHTAYTRTRENSLYLPPPPLPAHVCVCIDVCVRLSFAECGHHSRGQPGPSRAWIECAAAHIPHISLEQPLHLIVALFRDLRSLAVSMSEAPLFSSRG
jgi:hypothetical protein